MKIEIDIDDITAQILANSRGWTPKVEDTTQELIGDEYPLIDNPIPIESFLSGIIEHFIGEVVLNEIREKSINNIDSLHDKITDAIRSKNFDEGFKNGDSSSLLSFIGEELQKFNE